MENCIKTKIVGETLVAYSNGFKETVIEIVDHTGNKATKESFLRNRLESRQKFGYTLFEQNCLFQNCFLTKQW